VRVSVVGWLGFFAFNGELRSLNSVGHFLKKIFADLNAHVQEKALDALIAYLQAADADVGR